MKILVTGGAGFVGSHLCEKLVEDKHEVYSLDNYSTGKLENHVNGVTYIEGDTINIHELINFVPKIVYHLGEYSRVESSFEDFNVVWKSNKEGTFSVLKFCRDKKIKIVYAGSSTKFGDGGLGRSASPYAWTKSSNTELVKNFNKWFNMDYSIVYFYNVYGSREISKGRYATLIALFIEQYRNNEPLTVVSPGTQLRNFTHIDDIIKGLVLVGDSGFGDNYGIGSAKSYSVLDIANMFNSEIKMLPERMGNRMNAEIVCDKTKKLGWSEEMSVEDYIRKAIKNAF